VKVLTPDEWQRFEAEHIIRVDAATAGHRTRRVTAVSHPVEDFLFTYYANSVTALRRWHPGAGVGLVHADREAWRFYRTDGGVAAVDLDAYLTERGVRVATIRRLLAATLDRPASFGCFGLHEWAMLHHVDQAGVRHHDWPLRLGRAGTDAVVESHQVTCSHVDAFRFFTPTARPLNTLQPTRERQTELEQPGCLHAGMDCYKWAYQLVPAVPSELVMDCFDLARPRHARLALRPTRARVRARPDRDPRGQGGLRRGPARVHPAFSGAAPPAPRGDRRAGDPVSRLTRRGRSAHVGS
jgi:hypothetical protein